MSSYPLHRPDARLWFDRRFRSAAATHSLYCFPFAGGAATYYADWAPHCASPVELVPVQLPGRGGRMTEPSAKDLVQLAEEIADTIAAEPTRTLLYGHSMGAMLAFEVARRLQTLNRPVRHLFVSGRPAPTIVRPIAPVSHLSRAEFIQMLRDYGAADQTVFEHDELLDLLLPMIRADFAMIENYRYQEAPRLSCPISAWCGDADPEVPPTAMRGWGEQTSGEFTLSVLRGGHFFLTEHRAEIMRAVQGAIRRVR